MAIHELLNSITIKPPPPTRERHYDALRTKIDMSLTPRIRTDPGAENSYVHDMQTFFGRNENDEFSGSESLQYGKSTLNKQVLVVNILKSDHLLSLVFIFNHLLL